MHPVHTAPSRSDSDTPIREILDGLRQPHKSIPSKYFYDDEGSRLFDRITELDEYYLTRTEMAIMRDHVGEMVDLLGPDCLMVEFGSGSSLKTRILLDHLPRPVAYVPVDISAAHLRQAADRLRARYPGLPVLPVAADYTAEVALPPPPRPPDRVAIYFPGSTIGNFTPPDARDFLRRMAATAGPGGGILIGVDLRKDAARLHAAYNDAAGVTAAFNKNILAHLNRLAAADFDLDAFRHRAVYNEAEGRVEMYLVSLRDQCVRVGGVPVPFEEGEAVLTEYSYKYSLEGFAAMASEAGLAVDHVWTDADALFSVQYLRVR